MVDFWENCSFYTFRKIFHSFYIFRVFKRRPPPSNSSLIYIYIYIYIYISQMSLGGGCPHFVGVTGKFYENVRVTEPRFFRFLLHFRPLFSQKFAKTISRRLLRRDNPIFLPFSAPSAPKMWGWHPVLAQKPGVRYPPPLFFKGTSPWVISDIYI